jgi:tRNA(Ile2) C34 agmatinyltransferase TiaS
MVETTKGGLFGTAIGSEDYWKCPQCGKTLKATRDEDDLQDEVRKRVQGRIDRGEM